MCTWLTWMCCGGSVACCVQCTNVFKKWLASGCVCCFVLLTRYWGIIMVPGFPRERDSKARGSFV